MPRGTLRSRSHWNATLKRKVSTNTLRNRFLKDNYTLQWLLERPHLDTSRRSDAVGHLGMTGATRADAEGHQEEGMPVRSRQSCQTAGSPQRLSYPTAGEQPCKQPMTSGSKMGQILTLADVALSLPQKPEGVSINGNWAGKVRRVERDIQYACRALSLPPHCNLLHQCGAIERMTGAS